ncbi:acyl carrier protein [Archangium violaceum]|uniref:acyl carrier protein n=1 Tax=Archangium violaceum TaxID=83451 RepID=UPI0036DB5D14
MHLSTIRQAILGCLFLAPLLVSTEGFASPSQSALPRSCTQQPSQTASLNAEVCETVKAIIESLIGVEPERITEGASLVDDLGMDWLDLIEFTMALEMEFNIEIPDEDSERFVTVGGVCEYIRWRQNP